MGRAYEVRKAAMAKTAARKGKEYARFGAIIYKAAKSGIPDPELNQALKKEIERAKKADIPADIIKRAIEKAKGGATEDYHTVNFEGFGPGNSMIIVECLTDNMNRTNTEVRTAITRNGGKLGVSGSVTHMFLNRALFSFEGITDEEALEIMVEADCDVADIEYDDGMVSIYAPSEEYGKIRDALTDRLPEIEFLEDGIVWIPQMPVKIEDEEELRAFRKMINAIEELDDVQKVFHNIEGIELEE
ncbi:MAG: YebC/PmpR family DNA-binding transcriptional regulator [Bacillota bacterium]|jgi:YebC/PmpR family DNA-binding regulatory protein|nr:YebC/PmpR family DNA-binding transcriptional regulator [Bacillota bacterium]NLM32519.1 YebC/PmpR family DNA-binding transcriptional regulator [Acholeplasmataceae bacterium]HOA78361.1 YebC/PmpR family DNA-binding transcriptional regulator [Bacilli bacterium]HPZ27210.1 YebC/PmpR family DNA-binding transcriptional regulator [Bacilli bacterium]HQC89496.1 YebC/PmpR family DNA-binding transcriptional regulator [Bacilli bacterium]